MSWNLHVGDCRKYLADYKEQANLVLTSPPYDNIRIYGGHGFDWEDGYVQPIVDALAPGGVLVWVVADQWVDGSLTLTSHAQAQAFRDAGLKVHAVMIFEKSATGTINPARYRHNWEYMYVFSRGAPAVTNLIKDKPSAYPRAIKRNAHGIGRTNDKITRSNRTYVVNDFGVRTSIWYYPVGYGHTGEKYVHEHPAAFPIGLARDHIRTWTNPGDLVIDPFAGSGTTLRAAENLNRNSVGIEIHPPYAGLILRRMSQLSMQLMAD